METIASFVARTRGPVVPFVDDWYPWAYAHHYLRTEVENMPLELGRMLSSVRIDDAVSLIHAWSAATGEDVDEAVHLLADAYLERWGLAPPEDAFSAGYSEEFGADGLDLEGELAEAYDEEDVYAAGDAYAADGDAYDDEEEGEDATQLLPAVQEPDEALGAASDAATKSDRSANGRSGKSDRSGKGRTPRPVKAGDRTMMAEQILAADQALVAEHPLVTGRSLAARR